MCTPLRVARCSKEKFSSPSYSTHSFPKLADAVSENPQTAFSPKSRKQIDLTKSNRQVTALGD